MTGSELISVKQRFGIIGNSEALNTALEIALRVAPTDLSVLVTGESGVGKEFLPQVIHSYSARKHNKYIAVNCGAIPEGTIDSELFGHEKGSFTGAIDARKGYFEEADGGTIFLDEVGELPLSTQVRLLRVLQTGEFIRVGSNKVQKTNVRVVAATNNNLIQSIRNGRFREDLYYRLNTVPITVPPLRERKGDIYLLFRKFAAEVAVQYLPQEDYAAPTTTGSARGGYDEMNSERELLYKILFDMRSDINDLKRMMTEAMSGMHRAQPHPAEHREVAGLLSQSTTAEPHPAIEVESAEVVEENPHREITKDDVMREQIMRALRNNNNRRKDAARELFISERTLYRRMKALGIDEE